ncbi:MAG TPA: hypothetical protein VES20_22650 [Bryobacteraceae bacterium]|nr:hypothetical protein [Bryobacteraceae bacterium]
MRLVTRFFLLLTMTVVSAAAQSHYGYGFAGVSGIPGRVLYTNWQGTMAHAGLGGQARIGRGWTAGAEVGVISAVDNEYGRTTGLLSAGPEFHLPTGGRFDPFLTGGGSKLGVGGDGWMWFYGGGLNYWFRQRLGIRVEFRDHVWPTEGSSVRFTGVRAGLTFR